MKKIIYISLLFFSPNLFGQLIEIKEETNNWEFLINDLENDSIVCLGEESHWIETYLELKNSIIKTLHKEKNFNVVIFESGFVNSFIAYKNNLQSDVKLKETLYTLWQTRSTQKLINYIDSSQNTHTPIIQLGCDLKGPISFRFSRYLKNLFENLGNKNYGKTIGDLDSSFIELRHKWEPEIGKANRGIYLSPIKYNSIYKEYSVAIDSIQLNRDEILNKRLLSQIEFDFLIKCIQNRINLLELMQLPNYQQKHKYRDSIMAENTNWLIDEFVPNQKYLIWGADIHISKNAKWEEIGVDWVENKSMIELLSKKQSKKIFSVGIKPRKSLSKTMRKRLKVKSCNYYLNLIKLPLTFQIKFMDEHEAIIVCGKTKGIKKFKIKNDVEQSVFHVPTK